MSTRTIRPAPDRADGRSHNHPQILVRPFPRHRASRAGLAALGLLLVAVAGCGSGASSQRELSQRERDSTLGKSVLPGGAAVTRALEESDRASGAAGRMDAQVDSLPR